MTLRPKRKIQTAVVVSPDGTEEVELEMGNARDKVRLDGWTFKGGKKSITSDEIKTVEVDSPREVAPGMNEEVPPSELDTLRIEAQRLGVDVKGNWGINRLKKEIEAIKAAA